MESQWKITVLGCGSSASTPKIGCVLSSRKLCVCNSEPFDPRNQRLNPSIIFSLGDVHILIDAGKTFREAVLRQFKKLGITFIDALLLTHYHMDAVNGLDDLREVQAHDSTLPIYADQETLAVCSNMFPYLFSTRQSGLFVGQLFQNTITDFVSFTVKGLQCIPIPLHHGNVKALGFIARSPLSSTQFVYFSDFRCISAQSVLDERGVPIIQQEDYDNLSFLYDTGKTIPFLREMPISTMMLDCLHMEPTRRYISHSNFWETLQVIRVLFRMEIIPERIVLTGMSCTMDYSYCTETLLKEFPSPPCSILCGIDGMQFKL